MLCENRLEEKAPSGRGPGCLPIRVDTQASAPKGDKTYANQLKSAAILEKLLRQDPQHPGVSHFLIHAYDYPPLADKGLAAARRYAGVAPAFVALSTNADTVRPELARAKAYLAQR
jgi:hypothetical protein